MNPWRGLAGLPRSVWILVLATLINRAGTMALPFLVLYLTGSLRLSPAKAGQFLIVYGAAAMLAAPLGGRLSDRLGSLPVMRGSLLLSGLLMIALPFVGSAAGILAVVLLWALCAEVFRPASMAILADLSPAGQRKAVFALNRLAINLGMSVGPALGGALAARSYPTLFITDGVSSLLSSLVLILGVGGAGQSTLEAGALAYEARGAAWRDPRLMFFLLAALPAYMALFQYEGAMPLFLVRELRFSTVEYGATFTCNSLLILFFEVRLNMATARWSHRRTLTTGALLYAAGFGAMAFTRSVPGVLLSVAVWTFGEMVLLPGMSDYVAHLAPARRRGEYMGLYAMAQSLALCVGPWLGMVVYERSGGAALWMGTALSVGLSAVLLGRVTVPAASVVTRTGDRVPVDD